MMQVLSIIGSIILTAVFVGLCYTSGAMRAYEDEKEGMDE